MPRSPTAIRLTDHERSTVMAWRRSGATERQLAERADMVLRAADGQATWEIAAALGTRAARVSRWRTRFELDRLPGLVDVPRAGAPKRYGSGTERRVVACVEQPSPSGHAAWTGPLISAELGDVSIHQVWRILRRRGISLRRRSWGVWTDPVFARTVVDVGGLYLHAREHALVLTVDRGAGESVSTDEPGWLPLASAPLEAEFIRCRRRRGGDGTLCATLEVATELLAAGQEPRTPRRDILDFMKIAVDRHESGDVHVLLHRTTVSAPNEARWLRQHPFVRFHAVSTYDLWLEQAEVWFDILSGRLLGGDSLAAPCDLRDAIDAFVSVHDPDGTPFEWTKAHQ